MDFGVDGFLDKFEKHFGTLATKVLLILVGLAIVALALSTIWQFLVSPVLMFFNAPGPWQALVTIIYFGAATGAGVMAGRLAIYLLQRKARKRLRDGVAELTTEKAALAARIAATERLLAALEERTARVERDDQAGSNRPS